VVRSQARGVPFGIGFGFPARKCVDATGVNAGVADYKHVAAHRVCMFVFRHASAVGIVNIRRRRSVALFSSHDDRINGEPDYSVSNVLKWRD
jgi:hypothetical protein